jgi:hypothetical protein
MVIKENKIVYSRPSKIGQNWGFGTKIYYHLAALFKTLGWKIAKIAAKVSLLSKYFPSDAF